jgi:hypothetical protein
MKRIFLDMDGTLARFNVPHALDRFEKEEKFFAKLKAYKGVDIINELCESGIFYIISASPHDRADADKMEWIREYLPNMPIENIVLCRLGENKAKVIGYTRILRRTIKRESNTEFGQKQIALYKKRIHELVQIVNDLNF